MGDLTGFVYVGDKLLDGHHRMMDKMLDKEPTVRTISDQLGMIHSKLDDIANRATEQLGRLQATLDGMQANDPRPSPDLIAGSGELPRLVMIHNVIDTIQNIQKAIDLEIERL